MHIGAGFVPPDSPGASSFFTPQAHVDHSNRTLEHASSSMRNPVIGGLDRDMSANPYRHRVSADHLLRVGLTCQSHIAGCSMQSCSGPDIGEHEMCLHVTGHMHAFWMCLEKAPLSDMLARC